jgi:transposase
MRIVGPPRVGCAVLVGSLQRDPLSADRIERLRTVPGVGPITALTWALEMERSRVSGRSDKPPVTPGSAGAERSSADKVMRIPLFKQRNKHNPTGAGGSREAGTPTGP